MFDPPIHVHWPPRYLHKSLRYTGFPAESRPLPPKSQRSPLASIQLAAHPRAPGRFPGAGTFRVPYDPVRPLTFDPPIQIHWPPLYFHKSLRYPEFPAESSPDPPNSQRFPLASIQPMAPRRPPGTLFGAPVPRAPYFARVHPTKTSWGRKIAWGSRPFLGSKVRAANPRPKPRCRGK